MDKPTISVIIPVYNTQAYIVECLESVKNQTYKDYEVIIVNDGSTDNSEILIRNFISNNNLDNYYLLCKNNEGLCSARNDGLKHAAGEWIIFIDSDDWLEETCFENLIAADNKYHVDLVLTGFRAYDIETEKFDIWSQYTVEYGEFPKDLKSLKSFDYVWARMYKKAIIDENSLKFDERIKFCEDNAFNFDYVSMINSFACVHDVGYNYRRGHSGAMSKMPVNPHMRKYIREHMYAFCDRVPEEYICIALKENRSFSHVMWNTQLTDVVVDILEHKTTEAKRKMKHPLAKQIVTSFISNNKKDRLLRYFWNAPFFLFRFFIIFFYKNIDKIKKVKWLSHFLTH